MLLKTVSKLYYYTKKKEVKTKTAVIRLSRTSLLAERNNNHTENALSIIFAIKKSHNVTR